MKINQVVNSLRFKLIISSIVIQLLIIYLLISVAQKHIQQSLVSQAKQQTYSLEQLLTSALTRPFFREEYSDIKDIFQKTISENGVRYLVLMDLDNKVLVSSRPNINLKVSKTNLEQTVSSDLDTYHGKFDFNIDGVNNGKIYYGLSMEILRKSKSSLYFESVAIALIGLVMSTLVLVTISWWLTGNLRALLKISQAIAKGDLSRRAIKSSDTDVQSLAYALNNMADVLEKRISDLRNSRELQQELLQVSNTERARLSSLLAVMTRGIVFVTHDDRVKYYNPAFTRIWGALESHNLENQLISNVSESLSQRIEKEEVRSVLFDNNATEEGDTLEFVLNSGIIVSQCFYRVFDEHNEQQGTLWVFEDVTQERQTAQQLVYLAEHDSLTGLYNRRRFNEELNKQLSIAQRHGESVALLFFDVDDFKFINDAYGHPCGDELLVKIAGSISTLVRKEEMFCRLGGDEFAILLPETDVAGVTKLASRILSAIGKVSVIVDQKNLSVTSSIGVAVYPDHASNSEQLLASADIAMYQAKETGKNTWCVYEADKPSVQHMLKRIDWDNRLRDAIENDGFILHFQGVFNASNRDLAYYEVLVRLKSRSENNLLYLPGQFINVAERSGMIVEIDRIVLEKSIAILASNPSLSCLSVNISGRSIDDPELDEFIRQTLEHFGVKASRLMIEITETAAVSDLQDAQRFIDAMRQYGCKLAIDDFGAGYSSFVYLKYLDVDIIKIDGLFTHNLAIDRDNQIFIKAIVDMAVGLGRKTVAEFVESEETLQMVRQLGVDMVQGNYLQQPGISFADALVEDKQSI